MLKTLGLNRDSATLCCFLTYLWLDLEREKYSDISGAGTGSMSENQTVLLDLRVRNPTTPKNVWQQVKQEPENNILRGYHTFTKYLKGCFFSRASFNKAESLV